LTAASLAKLEAYHMNLEAKQRQARRRKSSGWGIAGLAVPVLGLVLGDHLYYQHTAAVETPAPAPVA